MGPFLRALGRVALVAMAFWLGAIWGAHEGRLEAKASNATAQHALLLTALAEAETDVAIGTANVAMARCRDSFPRPPQYPAEAVPGKVSER